MDPEQLLDHIDAEVSLKPYPNTTIWRYEIKIGEQTTKIYIGHNSFIVEEQGTKIDFSLGYGQILAIKDCALNLTCYNLWGDGRSNALSRAITLLNVIQSHQYSERVANIMNHIREIEPRTYY